MNSLYKGVKRQEKKPIQITEYDALTPILSLLQRIEEFMTANELIV